jgi:hypothetical protein
MLMLKNLRCPVRVVWAFRTNRAIALFTTDLALSVEQIICVLWRVMENQSRVPRNQTNE